MDNKKNGIQDLLHGPVWKTLIIFALPFTASSVIQMLYNTVDTIVVGHFVGAKAISAVSLCGNIVNLSITVCNGFSMAGQIMIAQFIGADRKNDIKKIISTLFILIGSASIIMSLIVISLLNPLLRLMSTPDEAFQMARTYMLICGGGLIFTAFYNVISAVFRGIGDSKHPFIFIVIASVTNIILDLLFTGVFGWGVAGVAWATILGQAVSVIFSLLFLLRNKSEFYFVYGKGEFRLYKDMVKMEVRLGLPMMLCGSAVTISVLFVNKFINMMGITISAAYGVGMRWYHIPNTIAMSIGQAASAMMGQNIGAGNYKRVRQIVGRSIATSAILEAVFVILLLIFSKDAFRLFTGDEAVVEYAFQWFIAMAAGAPAMATMGTFNSLITAAGDTRISMFIGLADALIGRIGSTVLLGIILNLGAMGLFLGFNLGVYVTAIPGAVYYFFVKWENRGLQIRKDT